MDKIHFSWRIISLEKQAHARIAVLNSTLKIANSNFNPISKFAPRNEPMVVVWAGGLTTQIISIHSQLKWRSNFFFQDHGACGVIFYTKVYYNFCKRVENDLAVFENQPAPERRDLTVSGSCVAHAISADGNGKSQTWTFNLFLISFQIMRLFNAPRRAINSLLRTF